MPSTDTSAQAPAQGVSDQLAESASQMFLQDETKPSERSTLSAALLQPTCNGSAGTHDRTATPASTSGRPAELLNKQHSKAPPGQQRGKWYLCCFLHRHLGFRHTELEAVAELAGCKRGGPDWVRWREPHGGVKESPYWYVWLPSEAVARQIAERALLVKCLVELWGEGADLAELQAELRAVPPHLSAPYGQQSFKIIVDGFGCVVKLEEQVALIEQLEFLPLRGPIRLTDPDNHFYLGVASCNLNAGLPEIPARMYFGRQVGRGDRRLISRYALPQRGYLGPTSMDAEMAFLMATHAKVRRGSLVLDPYVGTGSMLVAAAHYGAHTIGADIDIRVVRDGKTDRAGVARTVWTNFADYELPPPLGLLRMDAHRPPFRDGLEEVLDAILGDPPYGVRAGGRKSVGRPGLVVTDRASHIPATDPYTLGECLRDLLHTAARLLVQGGRLVYFLPATPETYDEADIPTHPALELVANCEQILTSRYSRRLITMEKVRRFDAEAAARHHQQQGDPRLPIDMLNNIVYETRKSENGDLISADRPSAKQKFRSKLT